MGKDRDSKGSSSALEMLVSRRSDRKQKDKKDRKKSSKRERSREKSKSVKRNRKRSRDDTEEKKPVKAANSGMHRRRIRWVHDDRMFKTRFFKINDEPIADGLSDAQMRDFRDRLLREATIQASSQTASRSMEPGVKSTTSSETIPWAKPKGVYRGEIDEHALGKNSTEKKQHEIRTGTKIACYFAREYQIPDKPALNLLNNARSNLVKPAKIGCILFKVDEKIVHEIESDPNAKLTYLTEQTRKQLSKKNNKSNIKKPEDESDKSEYSEEFDGEIDQEDELLGMAQFVGMMGQSFSNYKSYVNSLKKRINLLDEAEREKVKRNIEIITNVFDSNSKVLAVNSNKVIPDSNGMGSHGGQKKMGAVDKGGVKMVNKNYKTRHCNKYHSDAGCGRGEACHFIHDKEYKGRPVPEPDRPNRQHSKPPLITNYGGGNGYQNDRSRHSMQFGQPNSQYSHQQPSMGGGYYNPGMPASYPVSNVNSNFSISAQEGSALYSGMYKNAANYPINNGKSDKPAYNPMYGQIPMNGAQSNYMPSIGQPAPPPRK